jgi:hypothetical protein
MIVFANRRLGPAAELLVSPSVAASMLGETAAAARPEAAARWEQELVRWLESRVSHPAADTIIDVTEIAWSPDNFDRQRGFLLRAIEQASETSEHARALRLWAQMIEAHPRDSVQFGRRWTSQPSF